MALGATFWSTLGLSALWNDITGLTDGYNIGPGSGFRALILGPVKIYQEPSTMGGVLSRVQENPGFDAGKFYAKELDAAGGTEVVDGEELWCDTNFLVGIPKTVGTQVGQWVLLEPDFMPHDLLPDSPSLQIPGTAWDKSPVFKTGFIQEYDASRPAHQYSGQDAAVFLYVQESVGDWRLWHYSPFAWAGTVPEVIAAAAMHAGVSADYIDQDAFDNAHDAYDLSTGDAPWSDLDHQWTIHAARVVGEKVSDFIMQCAEHSRDLIFVNENGKLSISSKTRPGFSATGLTLKDDQIIDVISWTTTMKHTFNTVKAGWGFACRQSWEDTDGVAGSRPGISETAVSLDPTLSAGPIDKWVHEADDATSVSLLGKLWLKGRKVLSNFRGQPQEVEISHYPFLLSPHVARANYYEWIEATDGGGMVHITNWLASDAKPRAEIKIRQGPIGFDMGIGDLVTDLEITGDGRTIAEARVIERTYNFDTLTIDSLIMEIPPNT